MHESVSSGSVCGLIRCAPEDPGAGIALVPGLNGTAWLYRAAGAVHLCRETLRDILFLRNTVILEHSRGSVILAPSGAHGIAIQLSAGLSYIVPRSAIADVAHGLTPCIRFDPVPV